MIRTENNYTIGFAGHVDHGKTTLVKCLTGVDTDRKAEEKRRGMSIEAGVAPFRLPSGRSVAVIDVPGHVDFLKNTIRGLNSVDMGVMVVAADDGVMPQTREHLEVLNFFGTAAGMVILSKTDLVDAETADLAELEVRELLDGTFLENSPILRFSALQNGYPREIVQGIEATIDGLPSRTSGEPFRLWIDQVKSLPGHGTVVSGTVFSGALQNNDPVELLPAGIRTRARSLESHGCPIDRATAGQRVGINLHRVSTKDVGRGMSLATPGSLSAGYILNGRIRLLETAERAIRNRQRVKIYLGTSVINAMLILMESGHLEPGESGLVQLRLMKPVAARPRDTFVISPLNLNTVIAGGQVLETPREKFRTVKAESVLPRLTALRYGDPGEYSRCIFATGQGRLISAQDLATETGMARSLFEGQITSRVRKGELVYFKGLGAIAAEHLQDLKKQFLAVVNAVFKKDSLKKNTALGEITKHLSRRVDDGLLKIVADSLCKEGRLSRLDGGYCLPDSESLFDESRKSLMALLLDYARTSHLKPFSADTIWKLYRPRYRKEEISQLLNYLFSRKKLARLNDNRFLSSDAVEEIKRRVADAIARKGFVTVVDSSDLFGYGRWGGTHVLDYLDSIGFTVRREDKHFLKKNEDGDPARL